MLTVLKSLERNRIAIALLACGFKEEPAQMFSRVFLKKLLSTVDYHIRMTLAGSDTIEVICARIADTAFRGSGLTRAARRETYKLSEKLNEMYIKEAKNDPTGDSNPNK